MTGLREGWGVKVWTLGGLEVWTGLTLRGYHKGHKGHEEGGPGACRAWRASHATLWGSWGAGGAHDLGQEMQERPCGQQTRCSAKRRQPPSYASYRSYREAPQSANQLISQSARRSGGATEKVDCVQGWWVFGIV